MEINPHRSVPPIPKTERKKKAERSRDANKETEAVDVVGTELFSAIEAGLDSLPEIRQEQLELGRKLAEDPNYPSEDDLNELSELTLKNLPAEQDEDIE